MPSTVEGWVWVWVVGGVHGLQLAEQGPSHGPALTFV